MQETLNHFNTLYTFLTLIFACGVSYATIKVSLKSMSREVENLTKKVENMELKLHDLEIDKERNVLRFENIQRTLDDINGKMSFMSDFYLKLEKRGGVVQWEQPRAE